MENIRQAVERARTQHGVPGLAAPHGSDIGGSATGPSRFREAALDTQHLQANRIISHIVTDRRARSFDMLRTQILQLMDQKEWRILAVTSPTPACGKTVTALNLALSIARQPERKVLFVDLDFIKPMAASSLGLDFEVDARDVLEGRAPLSQAIINAHIGEQELLVVPCTAAAGSSELIASRAMGTMFQELQREFYSHTIILDLPPVLSSDDVIAILPHVDCVLLVVAIGTSTIAQIEECKKHLQTTEVARIVVNKVPEANNPYYYY